MRKIIPVLVLLAGLCAAGCAPLAGLTGQRGATSPLGPDHPEETTTREDPIKRIEAKAEKLWQAYSRLKQRFGDTDDVESLRQELADMVGHAMQGDYKKALADCLRAARLVARIEGGRS